MSKISDRLHLAFMHEADVVIAARAYEASAANIAADKRDAIRYSIIADWNAAVAAMKDSITYDIEDHEDGRWYCHFCSGNYTVGHTDDCRVLSLQAALARMEETDGND